MADPTQAGRLILLSAPSGAGKTTLVKTLLNRAPYLRFSVSFTTRPRRPNEVDGKDYYFVSPQTFDAMAVKGEFLECAEVFGNWYGTSRQHVDALIAAGHSVLLEIDWQGARQVRAKRSDAVSIFVMPPSIEELEKRLRGRATDSDQVIARRLDVALTDMAHWDEFDYVVINDDLQTAAGQLMAIIAGEPGIPTTADASVCADVRKILNRH